QGVVDREGNGLRLEVRTERQRLGKEAADERVPPGGREGPSRPQLDPSTAASADATAAAGSSAIWIPGSPAIGSAGSTRQLRRAMTGGPRLRAWAIAGSDPHPPPIAITAPPEAATARFRALPIPVATTWVQ